MNRTAARLAWSFALCCVVLAGCHSQTSDSRLYISAQQFASANWPEVIERARGSTVNFAIWTGDEARNRYFQSVLADKLKRNYGITLRLIPLRATAEAVNKLITEEYGGRRSGGSIDLVWINGENFRTAKQSHVLWGPFAEGVPNVRYYSEGVRSRDFGTAVDSLEAPWQRAQFVMAYDMARVGSPPRTFEALSDWIKSHPDRFTYIAPPDFTGSAFIRHVLVHFGGAPQQMARGFDEHVYQDALGKTIRYLNEIKPYLWRHGETYPVTPQALDRMFVNDEVDFSMSYNPSFASERILRGEFPATVRTFVFDDGTLGNYSFLAIPFNASNVAGALVIANYLMSPENALEDSQELGDVFPLSLDLLPPDQRDAADRLPRGPATLSLEDLNSHVLPEPDAEYLQRLDKDWAEKVLLR